MMKIPPTSPDLNPIENVWKTLNDRVSETMPPGFESVPHFKKRVRAAVRWVNKNKVEQMKNCVTSMPRRIQALLALKGAMTPY